MKILIILMFSFISLSQSLGIITRNRLFSRLSCFSTSSIPQPSINFLQNKIVVKHLELEDLRGNKGLVPYVDEGIHHHDYPPLVILGGTAQTIDTYSPHIKEIRKTRRVIFLEMRGQGQNTLNSKDCKVNYLIQDLKDFVKKLNLTQIDLCGFSFGGRVAMTFASHHPHLVRRLSITGVPLIRPALGRSIIHSWEEMMSKGLIRECAWSFILNGYSEEFIEHYHKKLGYFLDFVIKSNNPEKLHDLLRYSHVEIDPSFSISNCSQHVTCPTQIIAAKQDRIAGFRATKDLYHNIKYSEFFEMEGGHLTLFENPIIWRTHLLNFMNEK